MDRRNSDAYAPHAEAVHVGEQAVGRILIHVDDAAARMADLAHRVEHAGVVAQVRAGLHEDETLEAVLLGPLEVLLERRERRLVAQLRIARRVALRRPENMEVRVAGAFHTSFLNACTSSLAAVAR